MKRLTSLPVILGAIVSLFAITGASYAALDATGLRWTLIREHKALELRVAAGELKEWILINNKRLDGKKLSPAEQSRWCTLGLTLGVLKSCA